jgi:Domain of unknown function (DUF4349)
MAARRTLCIFAPVRRLPLAVVRHPAARARLAPYSIMRRPRSFALAVVLLAACSPSGDGVQSGAAKQEDVRFSSVLKGVPVAAPPARSGGGNVGDVNGLARAAARADAPYAIAEQAQAPDESGSAAYTGEDAIATPSQTTALAMDTTSATRPAGTAQTPSVAPAMIIRNGSASIEVDSLEPAVARVRQLAQRLGGYVAGTTVQTGRNQLHSASLQLKVPAARFVEAVGGLRSLGRVESVDEQTEDVGEEFVDVNARMDNARRLERRLVDLLATRTGKLQDVLGVERELARVREEIERYEGRARYLQTRAAISTVSINLHEPLPVIGRTEEGRGPIAGAFRSAWQNFVGFIASLIASLGVLIPLALLGWVAWRVIMRMDARRRSNGTREAGSAP